MRGFRVGAITGIALLALTGDAAAWSLVQEVDLLLPGLSAQMVWELPDAKSYCESIPPNTDRLACSLLEPDEFWIGLDGAGGHYGTINGVDSTGTFFDIQRRAAGASIDQHIARITKRVELVFGQPIKLFAASRWELDALNGHLLIGLRGQCLTSQCAAENDTEEHLGLLRISGLPALLDLAQTYVPPGSVSVVIPAHPEGLPTGSRLDLYAGDTADLPDLSRAQPLACNVGSGSAPGDTVVVADSLQSPAPGRARYYLTAVTSGSLRRAGRRTSGDTLVGRDAAAMPFCSTP